MINRSIFNTDKNHLLEDSSVIIEEFTCSHGMPMLMYDMYIPMKLSCSTSAQDNAGGGLACPSCAVTTQLISQFVSDQLLTWIFIYDSLFVIDIGGLIVWAGPRFCLVHLNDTLTSRHMAYSNLGLAGHGPPWLVTISNNEDTSACMESTRFKTVQSLATSKSTIPSSVE